MTKKQLLEENETLKSEIEDLKYEKSLLELRLEFKQVTIDSLIKEKELLFKDKEKKNYE